MTSRVRLATFEFEKFIALRARWFFTRAMTMGGLIGFQAAFAVAVLSAMSAASKSNARMLLSIS